MEGKRIFLRYLTNRYTLHNGILMHGFGIDTHDPVMLILYGIRCHNAVILIDGWFAKAEAAHFIDVLCKSTDNMVQRYGPLLLLFAFFATRLFKLCSVLRYRERMWCK